VFYMKRISDIQIKNAAPHIFARPFLFVEPNARMREISTLLAIGPQIYVDGLVVVSDNDKGQRRRPVGIIASKHIISNLLDFDYPNWLETKASQIMDSTVGALEMDSTLSSAIELFDKTRFGFAPIVNRDKERDGETGSSSVAVTAVLTIRDILPLIAKAYLTIPIKKISSPLVSVDGNTSILNALSYMIRTGIRNIGINEDVYSYIYGKSKILRIVNDRKMLEFLFSRNGREILHKNGTAGLGDINIINHLDMMSISRVKPNTTVSKAAELLMDICNPCLISEEVREEEVNNYIVTPWDVIMKTLRAEGRVSNQWI
jgi:CBS domain-containing protein